jgi:hypothetical protein
MKTIISILVAVQLIICFVFSAWLYSGHLRTINNKSDIERLQDNLWDIERKTDEALLFQKKLTLQVVGDFPRNAKKIGLFAIENQKSYQLISRSIYPEELPHATTSIHTFLQPGFDGICVVAEHEVRRKSSSRAKSYHSLSSLPKFLKLPLEEALEDSQPRQMRPLNGKIYVNKHSKEILVKTYTQGGNVIGKIILRIDSAH